MAVVLLILKWIGILLLAVLGLLLLVLAAVLFCPVRYDLKASYEEKADVSARIKWFFSLFSVRIEFHENKLQYRVRVFGKTILTETAEAKEAVREITETVKDTAEHAAEQATDRAAEELGKEIREEKPVKTEPAEERVPEPESAPKEKKTSKLAFSIRNICDKIKTIRGQGEKLQAFLEDRENQAAIALIKRQCFKLLRHILPKKFTAWLHFGFEDPATTGQVLGYICMFYALYGNNLSLEPDFDQKVLEGRCELKGRIRLGSLTGIIGRLIFYKRIRTWLFQLMK